MNRYRVRRAGQPWTAEGPDLLRKRANARGTLRALLGRPSPTGWFVRKEDAEGNRTEWIGPMPKVEALEKFDAWEGARPIIQFGRVDDGEVRAKVVVKLEDVPLLPLPNCSPETRELHSLVHYQFPKVVHSGDYLYRQIKGSDWWSDHAYGTALDESPRDGMPNDDLFTWEVRMFRSGNADSPDGYVIGSIKGRVMEASWPDWSIEPSDAASSHTWHVHTSLRDHDGVKPPRQGGVF